MNRNLLILFILLPLILSANIQWLENGLPVRQGDNLAKLKSVHFGDGTFLNVWNDAREGTRGIYAQRVNSNGNLLWDEEGIEIQNSDTMQNLGSLEQTSDSNVIISWQNFLEDAQNSCELRFQKLDTEGNRLWGENGIASPFDYPYSTEFYPDNSGGMFVFWANTSNSNTHCSRILADGTIAPGWENSIYLLCDNNRIAACTTEDNSCLVATTFDNQIYLQLIDSDGVKQWDNQGLQIATTSTYLDLDIVNIGSDFIVSIKAEYNVVTPINLYKISSEGSFVWENPIELNSEFLIKNVYLLPLSDNSFVVNYLSNDRFTFQKISQEGNLLWGEGVSYAYPENNYLGNFKVSTDNNENVVFSYSAEIDNQRKLYLQKLDAAGNNLFEEPGSLLVQSDNYSLWASLVISEERYYFYWHDTLEGSLDLLKHQICDYEGNVLLQENGIDFKQGLGGSSRDIHLLKNGDNPIILWEDNLSYQSTKIMMQVLNSDGTAQFVENGIPITATLNCEQTDLDVAISENTGTISAIWQNDKYSDPALYAQAVDTSGNMLWSDSDGVLLSDGNTWYENPQISSYQNGDAEEFYTGWSYAGDDFNNHIAAQKIVNGIPQWDEPVLIMGSEQYGATLLDIENRVYFWKDNYWGNESFYLTRFDEQGNIEAGWPEDGLYVGSGQYNNNLAPTFSLLPEGILITWLSINTESRNQQNIYGQFIDFEGNLLWDSNGKLLASDSWIEYYNLVVDNDIFLVWNKYESAQVKNYYMQKFDLGGEPLWGEGGIQVTTDNSIAFSKPEISFAGEDLLVVWENICPDNSNTMLKAQQISSDGELQYSLEGITIADAYYDQTNPQVYVNDNNAYIAWIDHRSTYIGDGIGSHPSIYAQKLVLEPTDSPEDVIPSSKVNLSNHPNPFNPTTEISFQLANSSSMDVKIRIYNVKGQLVKYFPASLCHPELDEGLTTHSVIWNGDDENGKPVSSGVYFYHLNVDGEVLQSKKMLMLK